MKKYEEKINQILDKNNGIISRKEVINQGIASIYFTKFIKENNLIKISKSEYIDQNYIKDKYYLLQKRFPRVIFSGYLGLFLVGLIDKAPENIEISIYKDYRIKKETLPKNTIIHIENNEEFFNIGNYYVLDSYGNSLYTYSKEKLIVEMIRKKDKYDKDIYIKALKNFLNSNDKSFELVFEYAKMRKIEKKVDEIFELLM